MTPARTGQKWPEEEDEQLLHDLRGSDPLSVIAARHQRSEGAIVARAKHLAGTVHQFNDDENPFDWARDELRRGEFPPDWPAQLRHGRRGTTSAPVSTPVTVSNSSAAIEETNDGIAPASVQRSCVRDYQRVLDIWAAHDDSTRYRRSFEADLDVLAQFDEATLISTAARLAERYGRVATSDWVLESDWPEVERLDITATELREGSDEARIACVELLEAAIRKLACERDRDVVLGRLGIRGSSTKLVDIGKAHGISRERTRQLFQRSMIRLIVRRPRHVFRAWDHVRGVLREALQTPRGALDSELVLSVIDLALPCADLREAVMFVCHLAGHDHDVALTQDRVAKLALVREQRRKAEYLEQNRQRYLDLKLARLVNSIVWPNCPLHDRIPLQFLCPLRSPKETDRRSISGHWESQLLHRSVGYDSKAELAFIEMLEASNLVQGYCEQPVEIEYALNGDIHRYFPDFLVDLSDGRRFLVEVKGSLDEFAKRTNMAKMAAAREYCDTRGWGLLSTANGRTLQDLVDRQVEQFVEDLLRHRLARGVVGWPSFREFLQEHKLQWLDVAAIIYRKGWCWQTEPFRVSIAPAGA